MRLALVLALFIGFTAHADFYPPEQALPAMGLPLSITKSVLKITVLTGKTDEVYGVCSGAVISNYSYVLTAGHCLEQCLLDNKIYDFKDGVSVVNWERLAKVVCRVKIDDVVLPAHVLAVNNCVGLENDFSFSPYCNGLDYAILAPTQSLNRPCTSVDFDTVLPVGESVTTLGFPMETHRAEVRKTKIYDSNGFDMYASNLGQIIEPSWTCKYHDGINITDYPFMNRTANKDVVQRQQKYGNLVQTTVDFVPGSSGGPLLDINSKMIVGLAASYGTATQSANSICDGSTFFTTTSGIAKEIAEKLPASQVEKIKFCHMH